MVAADARTAIVFALSPGNDHDAPHGRALLEELGPKLLGTCSGLACRLCCFGNRERLPDLFSRGCVQCDDAFPKGAALEARVRPEAFLERRKRLIEDALVDLRRRRNQRSKLINRTALPDHPTRGRVQRINR
jgi:hypothetical protein